MVEVLVSISVFTIIIFALFTTIIAMRKVVSRQEEYVRIKMACGDMFVHCKNNSSGWKTDYFGKDLDSNTGYLTFDFKPTADKPSVKHYIVTFDDTQILTIVSSDDKKVLIENLKLPLGEEE